MKKNTKVYCGILIAYLSILLLNSSIYALGPVGEKGITVEIKNSTITISGYTIVQDPSTGINVKVTSDNLFINKISNSTGAVISCDSISVPTFINGTFNGTNHTIIPNYNYSVNFVMDIPFTSQNISNQSSLFCLSQEQYNSCLGERSDYRSWYLTCERDKKEMTNYESNFSSCKDELSSIRNNLQNCNTEKSTANSQVTTLQTEQKEKTNLILFVGVGAFAAGIVGALWYRGYIGNKTKDAEANFNRSQAA